MGPTGLGPGQPLGLMWLLVLMWLPLGLMWPLGLPPGRPLQGSRWPGGVRR